ncbi:MAG: hypothetical protein RLY57_680 [Candidatus Parcubacteria bacterium]|jgi:putative hydrolase of HD superfamily
MTIDHILKFTAFLHEFRAIERRVWANTKERLENDAEHSYSLALLAWYINEVDGLGLDTGKLMKYALAHDLVEVYAGDTWFYQTDQKVLDTKVEKEHAALIKIKEYFAEFPELAQIIDEYEKRDNEESRFVYALDKVEPMLSIYLDKGRTWKKNDVTLEKAKAMKIPKVKTHATIDKYFHELLARLEQEEHELFPQDK